MLLPVLGSKQNIIIVKHTKISHSSFCFPGLLPVLFVILALVKDYFPAGSPGFGDVSEWPGAGLQRWLRWFDSTRRLWC